MIDVKQTHMVIHDYTMGDNKKLEYELSLFDDSSYKVVYVGLRYDEDKKELRIPRGFPLSKVKKELNEFNFNTSIDPSDDIRISIYTPPRNAIQTRSINYLSGMLDDINTRTHSQLILNLDTGTGKTYCTIFAIGLLGKKAIIITPTDKIKNQWIDSWLTFTDAGVDSVLNIDSSSVMVKLMTMKTIKYKFFVVNHNTVQSFIRRYGFDKFEEFMKKIRVGTKVFDEAHLNLNSMVNIDLHSNTKKTIYLTATMERSEVNENRVFASYFKNVSRYDGKDLSKNRKHIVYLGYMFNTRPSNVDELSIIKFKGFSRMAYIDYQMSDGTIYDVVQYLVDFFSKEEGKILVLSSKIESADKLSKFLAEKFPDKVVGSIHSNIKEEEKMRIYEHADIISSTPKSTGTGTDIPGLRYCINSEPYKSSVLAIQVSGRLRPIDGVNSFYVETVDRGFEAVLKLYKKRLTVFKKRCLKVIEILHKSCR